MRLPLIKFTPEFMEKGRDGLPGGWFVREYTVWGIKLIIIHEIDQGKVEYI